MSSKPQFCNSFVTFESGGLTVHNIWLGDEPYTGSDAVPEYTEWEPLMSVIAGLGIYLYPPPLLIKSEKLPEHKAVREATNMWRYEVESSFKITGVIKLPGIVGINSTPDEPDPEPIKPSCTKTWVDALSNEAKEA